MPLGRIEYDTMNVGFDWRAMLNEPATANMSLFFLIKTDAKFNVMFSLSNF